MKVLGRRFRMLESGWGCALGGPLRQASRGVTDDPSRERLWRQKAWCLGGAKCVEKSLDAAGRSACATSAKAPAGARPAKRPQEWGRGKHECLRHKSVRCLRHTRKSYLRAR